MGGRGGRGGAKADPGSTRANPGGTVRVGHNGNLISSVRSLDEDDLLAGVRLLQVDERLGVLGNASKYQTLRILSSRSFLYLLLEYERNSILFTNIF
jgi:hypothetical protein